MCARDLFRGSSTLGSSRSTQRCDPHMAGVCFPNAPLSLATFTTPCNPPPPPSPFHRPPSPSPSPLPPPPSPLPPPPSPLPLAPPPPPSPLPVSRCPPKPPQELVPPVTCPRGMPCALCAGCVQYHASLAEVAAAEARMFVNKPDGSKHSPFRARDSALVDLFLFFIMHCQYSRE